MDVMIYVMVGLPVSFGENGDGLPAWATGLPRDADGDPYYPLLEGLEDGLTFGPGRSDTTGVLGYDVGPSPVWGLVDDDPVNPHAGEDVVDCIESIHDARRKWYERWPDAPQPLVYVFTHRD
jgi:hypothetical protein